MELFFWKLNLLNRYELKKYMSNQNSAETNENEIVNEILAAVRSIRYGSVEIVIHDSKVVQIERKEKLRFENKTKANRTTGSK